METQSNIVRIMKIEAIIKSLDSEDLDSLRKKLDEEFGENVENPLLVAAEFGSYKVLKSIIELAANDFDTFKKQKFNFDDCNKCDDNLLHLGK